jgi:hypothetical protein
VARPSREQRRRRRRLRELDIDADGNAVVVWSQLSAGRESVWSNRFIAGGSWTGATLVETYDAGEAAKPRVAATGGGGAIAIWYQWDGARQSVWANHFAVAAGMWEGRQLLETSDAIDAVNPDVAADAAGNAVAVWEETDGATTVTVRDRRPR